MTAPLHAPPPPVHDHGDRRGDVTPARRSALSWLTATPLRLIALAVGAVLVIDAGGTDDGPGLCVYRRCTGGYCPGCGLTRSARHLVRGEVGAAWRDHPWMVLIALQAAVAAAVAGLAWRIGRVIAWQRVALVAAGFNVVLALGIWVARLADGSIPSPF